MSKPNVKTVQCQTINGPLMEVLVEDLTFRPSMYGVAIENGKVLLVKQWDGYDFPGGGVDIGELSLDALVCEIKEETGLDASPVKILHMADSFFFHPERKKPFHTPLIYHLVEIIGGEISIDGLDLHELSYVGGAEWVPIEEVPNLKFFNPIDSTKLVAEALKVKESLGLSK